MIRDAAGTRAINAGRHDERLVWLLGAPRTGSTWFCRLLGAVPNIAIESEPLVGAHLGARLSGVVPEVWRLDDDQDLWTHQRGRPDYVFSDQSRDLWNPALRTLLRTRFLTAHARSVRAGGYVIVREPHGSEASPFLFELLPESRLLHLVRDPRDVLDSVLDIVEHGWLGSSGEGSMSSERRREVLQTAMHIFTVRTQAVEQAWQSRPKELRLRVRYEDLRAKTDEVLTGVLDWLRVQVDHDLVEQAVDAFSFERLPDDQKGSGRINRKAQPGAWRETFSASEQKWLSTQLSDYLSRHGYDAL